MDKEVAKRLAEQRLEEWRGEATYADLMDRDRTGGTDDRETIGPDGVTYRVMCTVWKEQHDDAFTMHVKVREANGRRFFGGSASVAGRLYPNGSYERDA